MEHRGMGEIWQQPLKEKGERKPTLSPFTPLALSIKWKGNLIVMYWNRLEKRSLALDVESGGTVRECK